VIAAMGELKMQAPEGELKGSGVTVWVEGDAILIKYSVMYYGFLGTKRVPVENIKAITWNEPGVWIAGWLELSILGEKAPNPNASPNVQNQNRLKFGDADRDRFAALKDWIESKMVRPEAVAGSSVADEIEKLANLRDRGILSEAEFATQKARLLA
jgi:hypothetical protein